MVFDLVKMQEEVRYALAEDIGSGDVTASLIHDNTMIRAGIFTREPMLLAGRFWVDEVFRQLDEQIKLNWFMAEGQWIDKPVCLVEITGFAAPILSGERTALNFLQTLSGTATTTYHFVQALKGCHTQLLDTRKTIPGLRHAQKYAVSCGGGVNHRMGLYDAFLIKENHIKACGSITHAVNRARQMNPDLLLEVEVETLAEYEEALRAKPDRILLDNFDEDSLKKAVSLKPDFITLEASGGVNKDTIHRIAMTGVDYISVGALTKSLKAIDLTLLIKEEI